MEIKNLPEITKGTKEWASSNVNIYNGCSNDCRYCYAKQMAVRFKRKTATSWHRMELNEKAFQKGYAKRRGRIMFPSTHDITPGSLDKCIIALEKMLEAENEVLITTKPNPDCIYGIISELTRFKEQIQFRFTITSLDNDLLQFWEPGAPPFEDRKTALLLAWQAGFKTSISIEPFLDSNPIPLVELLRPYVTESIWIGPMNHIRTNGLSDGEKTYYEQIRKNYRKANLVRIYHKYEDRDNRVRFKDAFRNRIGVK